MHSYMVVIADMICV